MNYHAIFDENGLPTGFWAEGQDGIPEGAVTITEEQWLEFINNVGERFWDGQDIAVYTPPVPEPAKIIAGIKRQAAKRIEESGHDWMCIRQISDGTPVSQAVLDYAAAVRAASAALETTLPLDYADDAHWPGRLS